MSFPLTGLKVIDFSQGGAAPYCTQLMGDRGADVIKIEPPRGDWAREMGPFSAEIGMTATFASTNRNRRGMIQNPMTVEGQQPRYAVPPSLGEHALEVLHVELKLAPEAVGRRLQTKAAIAAAA